MISNIAMFVEVIKRECWTYGPAILPAETIPNSNSNSYVQASCCRDKELPQIMSTTTKTP